MRKRDALALLAMFFTYLLAILMGVWIYRYIDYRDINHDSYKAEQFQHTLDCQYPWRETNTPISCDNSDPACPDTLKLDGGSCEQQPLEQVELDGLAGK